jgi:hypothetical protein
MDITDSTPQRTAVAIERFLAGDLLEYEGVRFSRYDGSRLEVSCLSGWAPELATPAQAIEGIQRAKSVLADLIKRNESFRGSTRSLACEFHFCYDYGKGSIAIAKEIDGHFEWLRDE